MAFRPEVIPFLFVALALGAIMFGVIRLVRVSRGKALAVGGVVAVLLGLYMLYFFRDPPRQAPADPALIVAGADGTIMSVVDIQEPNFLKTNAVRISIFLSLFDVHVNRAPIDGIVEFAQYYPGARYFTFLEKSSEFNQHSTIVIRGAHTSCIVHQIVGPIARRVVYWLEPGTSLSKGDSIGMMKFASRLDMVFPKDDVEVVVAKGMKVRAGETVVARLKPAVVP
jgi:phosphatidylserine decarboxylase